MIFYFHFTIHDCIITYLNIHMCITCIVYDLGALKVV